MKRHNNNNNDDCFDVCCEKFCLCIGITISVLFAVAGAWFLILCLVGSILFPVLGTNTECGFRLESTVKMTEYNGTVINSTIYHSEKHEDDDNNHRYYVNYRCYNYLVLEPVFICKIHTYTGSNLTECIETQYENGTKISVYTTKKSDSCHINNLSRDCEKSNIYYKLGIMGIVIMGIIVGVGVLIGIFFMLFALGGN